MHCVNGGSFYLLVPALSLLVAACGADGVPTPADKHSDSAEPELEVDMVTAEQARAVINAYRAEMGLPPVSVSEALVRAAHRHSHYSLDQQNSACQAPGDAHHQVAGCEGFSGVEPWDRADAEGYVYQGLGECVHFVGDVEQAVHDWLVSVYHRGCIAAPDVIEVGFASAVAADGRAVDVLDVAYRPGAGRGHAARWPITDATDVPPSWDGLESPQPPPPPGGYPSGAIVGLLLSGGDNASIDNAALLTGEQPVPITFLTPRNDPHLSMGEYFLYGHAPLLQQREYTVELTGTWDNMPYLDEWTFRTGCEQTARASHGAACEGDTLLICGPGGSLTRQPCAPHICVEAVTSAGTGRDSAVCSTGATPCEPSDNGTDAAFIRCDGPHIIECWLGVEAIGRTCPSGYVCAQGGGNVTCALDPPTPCAHDDARQVGCSGNDLLICVEGFVGKRDCGQLFCTVNRDGSGGFCAAREPRCEQSRCAGNVPVLCVGGAERAQWPCAAGEGCQVGEAGPACVPVEG